MNILRALILTTLLVGCATGEADITSGNAPAPDTLSSCDVPHGRYECGDHLDTWVSVNKTGGYLYYGPCVVPFDREGDVIATTCLDFSILEGTVDVTTDCDSLPDIHLEAVIVEGASTHIFTDFTCRAAK